MNLLKRSVDKELLSGELCSLDNTMNLLKRSVDKELLSFEQSSLDNTSYQ